MRDRLSPSEGVLGQRRRACGGPARSYEADRNRGRDDRHEGRDRRGGGGPGGRADPGGTRRNKESLDRVVNYHDAIDEIDRLLLCDAQTSGGLLFAVEPSRFAALLSGLAEAGVSTAAIGELVAAPEGRIEVGRRRAPTSR